MRRVYIYIRYIFLLPLSFVVGTATAERVVVTSGRVVYDAFGRVIATYHPTVDGDSVNRYSNAVSLQLWRFSKPRSPALMRTSSITRQTDKTASLLSLFLKNVFNSEKIFLHLYCIVVLLLLFYNYKVTENQRLYKTQLCFFHFRNLS